jgi:hypothetical protein
MEIDKYFSAKDAKVTPDKLRILPAWRRVKTLAYGKMHGSSMWSVGPASHIIGIKGPGESGL